MRTLAIKIFIVSVWLLFCSVKAGFCQKNKRQDLLFEIVKDGQPKSYIYSTFYSIDFDFLQVSDSVFDLFDGCSNFVTEYDFDLFFSEAISNILESEASVKNHPIFQESGWNNTEDEYLHLLSSFDLSRKTQKKTNTKHKIKASIYEFLVNRADHASLNTLGLDTTNQEYLKATKLVGLVNNSEISEEEKKRVSTYVFECLLNHEVSITNELYQTFLQADTSSLHESMIKFGSIHDTNEKRAKNRWMTDRLEKIMSSGSTFTLLSPGSIVGSGGILQLLKERGYTIRKVVSKYDFSVVKKINENKVGSKLSRTQFCTPVYNICADFPVKPVKINDGPIFSEIYVSYDQRTNVNYTLSAFRVDDVADQKETFRNFKENLRNSKDFSGLQYTGDIEKGSIISNHFKARHLNGYCEGQILLGENVLVIFFATAPKLVSLYQAECAKLINTIKINEQNAIVQSSQENWINYSSTASGFTCRIPNVFTTKSDINDNSGNTLGAYREFEYQLPDNSCIFKINILTPVKNQSITEYIDIKEHIKRVYCNNETNNLSSTIDPISIGNLSAVGITATSDDYFDQYVAFIRGNTFWEIEARGNPARTKDAEYFINSFRPEKLKTASLSKTKVPFFKIVEPIFPDNTEPNFSHSTHGGSFSEVVPVTEIVKAQSVDYTANVHFSYQEAEFSPLFHCSDPKAILDSLAQRNKSLYNLANYKISYPDELSIYAHGSAKDLNFDVHYKSIIRGDRIMDMVILIPSDLNDPSYVDQAVTQVKSSLPIEEELSSSKVAKWVGLSKKLSSADGISWNSYDSLLSKYDAALQTKEWPFRLSKNDSLLLRNYYKQTILDSNRVDIYAALKITELYASLMPTEAIAAFNSTYSNCDAPFCSAIAFHGILTCPFPSNFYAYKKIIRQLEMEKRIFPVPLPTYSMNPEFYHQKLAELKPLFVVNPIHYFSLPEQLCAMYVDSSSIVALPAEISSLLKTCMGDIAKNWSITDNLVREKGLDYCLQLIHKIKNKHEFIASLNKLKSLQTNNAPVALTLAESGEKLNDENWNEIFNSDMALPAILSSQQNGFDIPPKYLPNNWKDVSLMMTKGSYPDDNLPPVEIRLNINETSSEGDFQYFLYKLNNEEGDHLLCGPFPAKFDLLNIQNVSSVNITSTRFSNSEILSDKIQQGKKYLMDTYNSRCAENVKFDMD